MRHFQKCSHYVTVGISSINLITQFNQKYIFHHQHIQIFFMKISFIIFYSFYQFVNMLKIVLQRLRGRKWVTTLNIFYFSLKVDLLLFSGRYTWNLFSSDWHQVRTKCVCGNSNVPALSPISKFHGGKKRKSLSQCEQQLRIKSNYNFNNPD